MAIIIAGGKVFTTDLLSETEIVYRINHMTRNKEDFKAELTEAIDSEIEAMKLRRGEGGGGGQMSTGFHSRPTVFPQERPPRI